eukprot:378836-Prorocentrum_minimum.AAC.1
MPRHDREEYPDPEYKLGGPALVGDPFDRRYLLEASTMHASVVPGFGPGRGQFTSGGGQFTSGG